MRLWSFHPRYLDTRGLVALWREALLAQKVLRGLTRGYKNHPQLERFKSQPEPVAAIGAYLRAVWDEGARRGYRFDREKIFSNAKAAKIPVTSGQVDHEWARFKKKLRLRNRAALSEIDRERSPALHPMFLKTKGLVAQWEKSTV